jgi:DNA-binding MarR family transcriptional regulator
MANKSQKIHSIAQNLISQHNDINIYNFLSFLSTSEMVFQYLDQEFHQKIGMDRTKIQILDLLVIKGGTMTPSQLSRSVNRKKITLTTALDNLEKQGLIKSAKVKKDRRLRLVTITDKGLDIVNSALPLRQEIFAKSMQCLNEKEAISFQSLISRLREHIYSLSGDSNYGNILQRFQDYTFINQIPGDNSSGEKE